MNVYALTIDENSFPAAKFATLDKLVNLILPLLTTGAALLLLVMLLYGGFIWLTASDNPENLKKAQKTMTFAILGLVIVIASYLIVKLIGIFFKVTLPI